MAALDSRTESSIPHSPGRGNIGLARHCPGCQFRHGAARRLALSAGAHSPAAHGWGVRPCARTVALAQGRLTMTMGGCHADLWLPSARPAVAGRDRPGWAESRRWGQSILWYTGISGGKSQRTLCRPEEARGQSRLPRPPTLPLAPSQALGTGAGCVLHGPGNGGQICRTVHRSPGYGKMPGRGICGCGVCGVRGILAGGRWRMWIGQPRTRS